MSDTVVVFWERLRYRKKNTMVKIYVNAKLERSLLNGIACEELGILKRLDEVKTAEANEPIGK